MYYRVNKQYLYIFPNTLSNGDSFCRIKKSTIEMDLPHLL